MEKRLVRLQVSTDQGELMEILDAPMPGDLVDLIRSVMFLTEDLQGTVTGLLKPIVDRYMDEPDYWEPYEDSLESSQDW